jgi:hypothetical protein
MFASFSSSLTRPLALMLLLIVGSAHADLKIRPDDKIKETPRDFQKENEKFGFPTPEPQKAEGRFVSGGSVDVVLEASTRYLGTVQFQIREQPKYGKLSAIRPKSERENHKVIITYLHNGDPTNLNDSFTYVVRIGEGSTSVPATVTLRGQPSLPRLEVAQHPRFKRLAPEEEDLGRAVIRNVGTATFDGLVTWDAPFYGPPKLILPAGEQQEILVRARPTAPGSYKLGVMLQPGTPASMVKGSVECALPYVISPGTLELAFDPASGQRKGTTRITNASTQPLSLRLDGGQRVQVAAELTLQPQESQDVVIALAADDVSVFRGEVSVYQDSVREKVFVNAAPEPAQLKIVMPENGRLEFGTMEKGAKAERVIRIANHGGMELVFNATDSPPFVFGKQKPFRVPPGSEEEFVLRLETDQGGKYEKSINLSGNGGSATLAVSAVMNDPRRSGITPKGPGVENPHLERAPSRVRQAGPERGAGDTPASAPEVSIPASISNVPPSSSAGPAAPPAAVSPSAADPTAPKTSPVALVNMANALQKQVMAYASAVGVGPGDQPGQRSTTLTPVPSIGVLDAGRDHLVLGWKNPEVEPVRFQVESAVQMRGKDTPMSVKTWLPIKEWTAVPAPDGSSAARIEGLSPGARYELRVTGVDADGKYSKASTSVLVSTLPPFRMPPWLWVVLAGLVTIAGLMIYRQRLATR